MAKSLTPAEKRYMGRVADIGCLICGQPTQLHHIREDQGAGQKAGNFLIIPLCVEHHLGDFSIHKARRQFINIYGSELKLLNETIKRVNS